MRYALPPLLDVLVPVGIAALAGLAAQRAARRWLAPAGVLLVVGAYMLAVGGRGPADAGLQITIPPEHRPLYRFIGALPAGALIAGWPDL